MKMIQLNEIVYAGPSADMIPTRPVAVNPSMIIMIAPCSKGTEVYFMDEGMIVVQEGYESLTALLCDDALWRLP